MIACKQCGREVEEQYRFCLGCGAPMQTKADEDATDMPIIEVSLEPLAEEMYEDVQNAEAQALSSIDEHDKVPEPRAKNAQSDTTENDFEVGEIDEELLSAWKEDRSFKSEVMTAKNDRICSECGFEVDEGHKFCGQCGKRFVQFVDQTRDNIRNSASFRIDRVSFVGGAVPVTPSSAIFRLVHINEDGSEGASIALVEGDNVIGRNSSAALQSDPYVSPQHFVLQCKGDAAEIDPRGSLNGVFLRIVSRRLPLRDGMIFRIGEELIQYIEGNSEQVIVKAADAEGTKLVGSKESSGWGYLRMILGAYVEGDVYRLAKDSIEIGRTRGDIIFEQDGFVSGQHLILQYENGDAYIEDVGSSNGTFIRLSEKYRIRKPTHILVGNQLLLIEPL
ncbi:MAG: FHA domain-containing protein [Bradymonadales bacterium]